MDRFEDVLAWRKARALNKAIYAVTRSPSWSKDFRFCSQIQSAALSIMNNIAEGFERNRPKELHQFLSIAKGSAAEVRSMLYAAEDVGYLSAHEAHMLRTQAAEVTRLVAGFRASVERRLKEQEGSELHEELFIYDEDFFATSEELD